MCVPYCTLSTKLVFYQFYKATFTYCIQRVPTCTEMLLQQLLKV